MSKTEGTIHVGLMLVNAALSLSSLAAGDIGFALFSGSVAAILAWQLTW